MADSTLQEIRTTVRRITRTPSTSQMSDTQLDQYINTFFLFDFPESLRLSVLRTTLTFYTQPGVDIYASNSTDPNNALYDFKNLYTAIHQPVYMAGIGAAYTQYRNEFFRIWPKTSFIYDTGARGDSSTTSFSGTLQSVPVMQNEVNFNALDITGTAMILVDNPQTNVSGQLNLVNATPVFPSPYGSINYITGVYTVNFPSAPVQDAPIYAETVPYAPGKPTSMLFYDNQFVIRPIPQAVYPIQVEADQIPTELLASDQNPQINQWAQYIAIGASMKIFRDRMDMDSMQLLMPEFDKQERFVNRPTLENKVNQRTQTIYTAGKNYDFAFPGNVQWPY